MRIGFAAGLIATVLSIPFLTKGDSKEDKLPKSDNSVTPNNLILSQKDFDEIQELRKKPPSEDYRLQETKWAERVYPMVRERLINLYKAELDDIRSLTEKKITEKDRKVKIYLTDFVKPGHEGDDMGKGPNLHVVKYFDEKQKDGSTLRTYVNEHWPVDHFLGGILPPENIRVRVQAFKGSLYEQGADNLFVTDMLQLVWNTNMDNSKPGANIYPLFARQHFYGEYDTKEKSNKINQVETFVSNPTSCVSCHKISKNNSHVKHLLHELKDKRINYGAITQDGDFEKPYNQHPGFQKLMSYYAERVKAGFIKQKTVDAIANDLMDSRNLENPYIVPSFEEAKEIPWLDSDWKAERYEAGRDGFTYMENDTEWERAIYSHYANQLDWLGLLWFRRDLKVLPK